FSLMLSSTHRSTLFPYTTLFRSQVMHNGFYRYDPTNYHGPLHFYVLLLSESLFGRNLWALRLPVVLASIGCVWLTLKFEPLVGRDRKSTRLNSSHVSISYAVFCL